MRTDSGVLSARLCALHTEAPLDCGALIGTPLCCALRRYHGTVTNVRSMTRSRYPREDASTARYSIDFDDGDHEWRSRI